MSQMISNRLRRELATLAAGRGVDMVAGAAKSADLASSAAGKGVDMVAGAAKASDLAATNAKAELLSGVRDTQAAPAFIEQHIAGFFGRGMLTAETINVVTEQPLTAAAAVGATSLACANAANFVVGGCVTVKHDNGRYATYFVGAKTGNTIGIRPSLRFACATAAARIERTWFNRAHPGKFYMRELAQRVAHSTELDAAMPNGGRVLFTNFASDPNTIEDTLVSVGGASLYYYAPSNTGSSGSTTSPVRFGPGRSAYVENITAVGAGAETQLFDVRDVAIAVVKIALYIEGGARSYAISVIDEKGVERGRLVTPVGVDAQIMRLYTLVADLRGALKVKVRVAAATYSEAGGYVSIGQIDVFEAQPATQKIIANPSAKIVCLGDSWVGGDLGSTPEREPIPVQLAAELPQATVINAGVGGNTIWQQLARFDADVAAHKPDYVVINTGTNEAYNPGSVTFEPTAVDAFLAAYNTLLSRIASIGARAIIIGVPALAQSDAEVSGLAEWTLNDRAKRYATRIAEWQEAKPFVTSGSNANGSWVKFDDGTMICRHTVSVTTTAANTVAGAMWTFPVKFASAPHVVASVSAYDTNQIVSVGVSNAIAQDVNIRMVTGVGAATLPVHCIAIGRWRQ